MSNLRPTKQPRIRHIKPEFFQHEDLFDIEERSKLPVRLALIGLWTCADCEGRFEWQPRRLKLNILPYDLVDFSLVLEALASGGFVRKYEVEGKQYGVITSFAKHQHINRSKEPKSYFPAPPAAPEPPSGGPQAAPPASGSGSGSGSGSVSGSVSDTGGPAAAGEPRHTGDQTDLDPRQEQNPLPFLKGVSSTLEYISTRPGAPQLRLDQYAGMEQVLLMMFEEAFVKANNAYGWFQAVEAIVWAQTKSNYWPSHVINLHNFKQVLDQYEKFYAKTPEKKRPHEILFAQYEAEMLGEDYPELED